MVYNSRLVILVVLMRRKAYLSIIENITNIIRKHKVSVLLCNQLSWIFFYPHTDAVVNFIDKFGFDRENVYFTLIYSKSVGRRSRMTLIAWVANHQKYYALMHTIRQLSFHLSGRLLYKTKRSLINNTNVFFLHEPASTFIHTVKVCYSALFLSKTSRLVS
jgi:hypothetical protein